MEVSVGEDGVVMDELVDSSWCKDVDIPFVAKFGKSIIHQLIQGLK